MNQSADLGTYVGVGEADWSFKTTFSVDDKLLSAGNADLVFEGLDTFATVSLVGINSIEYVRSQVTYSYILTAERNESPRVSTASHDIRCSSHNFLSSENQFVSHRVPVKEHLRASGNELVIDFVSAFRKVGSPYLCASIFLVANLFHFRDAKSRSSMKSCISGTATPVGSMSAKHSTSTLAPYLLSIIGAHCGTLQLWMGLG